MVLAGSFFSVHDLLSLTKIIYNPFFVPSEDTLKKQIIFMMFEEQIADVNATT